MTSTPVTSIEEACASSSSDGIKDDSNAAVQEVVFSEALMGSQLAKQEEEEDEEEEKEETHHAHVYLCRTCCGDECLCYDLRDWRVCVRQVKKDYKEEERVSPLCHCMQVGDLVSRACEPARILTCRAFRSVPRPRVLLQWLLFGIILAGATTALVVALMG